MFWQLRHWLFGTHFVNLQFADSRYTRPVKKMGPIWLVKVPCLGWQRLDKQPAYRDLQPLTFDLPRESAVVLRLVKP